MDKSPREYIYKIIDPIFSRPGAFTENIGVSSVMALVNHYDNAIRLVDWYQRVDLGEDGDSVGIDSCLQDFFTFLSEKIQSDESGNFEEKLLSRASGNEANALEELTNIYKDFRGNLFMER